MGACPVASVLPTEADRSFFRPGMFALVAAALVSLVLHMAAVVLLASWRLPGPKVQGTFYVLAAPEPIEALQTETLEMPMSTAQAAAVESQPLGLAAAAVETVELDTKFDLAEPSRITLAPVQALGAPPVAAHLDLVPQGRSTEAGRTVAGNRQAVDAITEQIERFLATGNVLVVWCFDQSGSMQPDRAEIRGRVRKIYEQIAASGMARPRGLLSAVTSFGQGFQMHGQPTESLDEIEQAIDTVPVDASGVEMLCQAVANVLRSYQPYVDSAEGKRQLVIVVVTDECGDRGDHRALLEKVIDDSRRVAARVFVIGREAPMAMPTVYMPWTDPETKRSVSVLIDRGPESAYLEGLTYDGIGRRADMSLGSGYGPYAQVRLARETGGLFFMLGGAAPPDSTPLRQHAPQWDPLVDCVRDRMSRPHRQAVFEIASDLDATDEPKLRNIVLPTTFGVEPERFVPQVAAGLTAAMKMVSYYDRQIPRLEGLAASRKDETNPRWQANFDLLLAQLLAYRARTNEFLACLDAASKEPPTAKNVFGEAKPTNYWRAAPVARLLVGDRTQADIDRAAALFKRIGEEHAGTAWQRRAQWEMSRLYGWELRELHVPQYPPPPARPNL